MEYLNYDMDGYDLHVIKTDRFKTVFYSVNIRFDDERETERYTSLLSRLLIQTSKYYSSLRDINAFCASIYDPSYNIRVLGSGAEDILSLTASFANEKYTEKGMNEKNFKFLSEFIFEPKVVDGGFDREVFETQKEKLLEYYRTLRDNPQNYANSRLAEEMKIRKYDVMKIEELIQSVNGLTAEELYDFYKKVMSEGKLDIFVCGDVDGDEIRDVINKLIKFNGSKRGKINHLVRQENYNKKEKIVIEPSSNTQSNLIVGCKLLDLTDFEYFINMDRVAKEIDKLKTIDIDLSMFDSFTKDSDQVKRLFKKAYEKAYEKTDRQTYQAMEAFIHNLNTMHSRAGAQVPFSSINFGTDTSPEGRMVMKNYLLATDAGLGNHETPIFPISIFKVKEGVNYNEGDPNYDLFKLSCEVSAKRLFPNFSFIDAPFNLEYYKPDDYETEVGYMGCRTRVLADITSDYPVTPGRGNLSFTSINLPRLGIKHGIVSGETDLDGFFKELEELMELVKDQLLERFEIQCSKRIYNFPFLLGQGVWMDSEKLKPTDRLRKVLKHGTLTIGFIGLAECLKALIGKHHGESEEAQKLGLKIIGFMRKKLDEYSKEYNLNFSLIATPAEGLSGRFTNIDKAIYGKIKGVTDKDYYTNSFHVPVYYNISAVKKIQIEAPYHALTNGGHITYVELDGDTAMNVDAFEKIIRVMHDNGIGYGAINHPVDRDPVCGYTGVIGDFCPGCGRKEGEGVPMERIKNASLNSCGGR